MEPGFSKILIQPQLCDLKWAEGFVLTLKGRFVKAPEGSPVMAIIELLDFILKMSQTIDPFSASYNT